MARSRSLNGVFQHLGLIVGGSQWLCDRAGIKALGLSTDHWVRPLGVGRQPRRVDVIRKQLLERDLHALVRVSSSRADLLRRVGLESGSTTWLALIQAFAAVGIEPARLNGWQRVGGRPRGPLEDLLVIGDRRAKTSELRERLIDEGIFKPRCAVCEREPWQDLPIPLQLDHRNGDRRDNRVPNLTSTGMLPR